MAVVSPFMSKEEFRVQSSEFSKNYFELLGLEQSFDIDSKKLHQSYLQLQKIFHPDVLSRKGDAERLAGIQLSADVNNAYKTLQNPLQRAEYILSLHEVYVASETGAVKADMSLLMESMELREALSDTDSASELQEILSNAKDIVSVLPNEFSTKMNENNLPKAAQIAIRWRFMEKYIQEIELKIKTLAIC